VELGREPSVESQLLLAVMPASLQGGGIHEVQLHRFLDLVSKRPRQNHPGDVRLDKLEPRHCVWKCTGVQQLADLERRGRIHCILGMGVGCATSGMSPPPAIVDSRRLMEWIAPGYPEKPACTTLVS